MNKAERIDKARGRLGRMAQGGPKYGMLSPRDTNALTEFLAREAELVAELERLRGQLAACGRAGCPAADAASLRTPHAKDTKGEER